MTLLLPNRRGFLTGLVGLIAAPAIVKASSLMPISVQPTHSNYQLQAISSDGMMWRWVQLDTFGKETEYYTSASFDKPNPKRFHELNLHYTKLGYTLQDTYHGYEQHKF